MANSVTARFNDDCKVFVSMSDDTTVEKAVIIDAEGNETDIGGGGGGDYTTATLTIIINGEEVDVTGVYAPLLEEYNDELIPVYRQDQTEQTVEYTVILFNGKAIVSPIVEVAGSKTLSGNITSMLDHDNFLMTGDASITYDDL